MKNKTLFSFASGTLMLAGQAFAQPYSFVPIDVSCPAAADASACPAGLAPGQVAAQTSARGINARGDVVGVYVAGGRQHGFLLTDGQYTSLDFPAPGVRATAPTASTLVARSSANTRLLSTIRATHLLRTRPSIAQALPILPASKVSITGAANSQP